MRILGVDPAAAGPTGYGVVEADGLGCRALDFGALRHARSASPAARLRAVHALLSRLVKEYAPDAMALESAFTARNRKTALRLAEVRGVVLLAAAQNGVSVHSYSPREVKASVVGHGHADKRQVQQMVRVLLGLRQTPEPPDASDALAVALCHLHAAEARGRLGGVSVSARRPAVRDSRTARIPMPR